MTDEANAKRSWYILLIQSYNGRLYYLHNLLGSKPTNKGIDGCQVSSSHAGQFFDDRLVQLLLLGRSGLCSVHLFSQSHKFVRIRLQQYREKEIIAESLSMSRYISSFINVDSSIRSCQKSGYTKLKSSPDSRASVDDCASSQMHVAPENPREVGLDDQIWQNQSAWTLVRPWRRTGISGQRKKCAYEIQ